MRKLRLRKRYIFMAVAAAAAVVCAVRVWLIEPAMLISVRSPMPVADLPAELENFSILLISDPHFKNGERERMEKFHRAAEKLKPDMILLLGDYRCLSFNNDRIPSDEDMNFFFSNLRAPCGVFAVFGNHDFWHTRASLKRAARNSGVRFLESEWVKVDFNGSSLLLFGAEDLKTGREVDKLPDAPEHKGKMIKLLVCHNPETMIKYREMKFDGAFAGHLHGGQLRFPWERAVLALFNRVNWFERGLNKSEYGNLFLTSGAGSERFSARWNCPPEVVLIKLCRPEKCRDIPVYRPEIEIKKTGSTPS